jgi:uncharacterized protein YfiM (DUF2279 family)
MDQKTRAADQGSSQAATVRFSGDAALVTAGAEVTRRTGVSARRVT